MKIESLKIIIWGKDGYNALGLLRQLHGIGEVIFLLYGSSKFCAVKSRYCKNLQKTKTLEDGIQWLLSSFSTEKNKPFIIPTGDIVAEYIDKNKEKLDPLFILTGTSEPGLLTKILDKNLMSKMAEECGFLVPNSRECNWNTDTSGIKYPCILKPNKKHRGQKKLFKTRICNTEEELGRTLSQVGRSASFILQEYIPKQYDALVYGCRTIEGNVILPGLLMKDRWDVGGDGVHGYLTYEIPSSISLPAIEKFLSQINYHGIFSVEFGIVDDKAFFYEFNLRNDGTSHYFFQAGVNIPLIWIFDSINKDYSYLPQKLDGYHDYIAIVDDLANVTSGKITLGQWRKDKRKATVYRFYDKNDMIPFYYNAAIVMFRPLKNAIKSLKKIF